MSDAADQAVAELLDTKAIVDLTITYTWLLDHGPHADLAAGLHARRLCVARWDRVPRRRCHHRHGSIGR